jgi:hypothetical protein
MGMTDIISCEWAFAAYLALLSHIWDSFAIFFEKREIYNVRWHMARILSGNVST